MEPIEERVHESEASHNADSKHLRALICAKEAVGLHKRVKRIHDPAKIVVSCAVVEVEFPIPADRSMQLSPYIGIFDDHILAVASQRGLRCRGEVDKTPAEAASIVTEQIPSIDTNTSPSIDATISTVGAYQSRRSLMCVKIFLMDASPRDQINGVGKSIVRSICFSQPFAKLRALLIAEMIDKGEESMEEAFTQE
ncbi:hypothetical protein F2Q69_00007135 [Brassica cretica]|uniref:Uncharacterized protein n=1 Tax=Brassica cretica TaxID=69181 RepID=A0A8S9NXI4_BRACR|nr:hypothetical protein F2Q69_00007135 [Brassica cretica]